MSAKLIALSDGPDLTLEKPILLIGRHPECDIQLNSRKISRRHCIIGLAGSYLIIRDLGSTNGVRINGHRTDEGKAVDSDELLIGNFRYRVRLIDEAVKPIAKQSPKVFAPLKSPPVVRPIAKPSTFDPTLDEAEEPIPLDEVALSRVLTARPAPPKPPKPPASPPTDVTHPPAEERPSSGAFLSMPPPEPRS